MRHRFDGFAIACTLKCIPHLPCQSSRCPGFTTGLRLSEVVDATVDDLTWVEYPTDSMDDEATEGWMLRVIGKGQKEREVLVPIKVVGELAKYVKSRGLDPDPEDIGNQGAHLLGKAGDAAQRAPRLSHGGAARSEAAHRGDRLLRPDQGVLQRLRRRAARAGRCTGEAERIAKAGTPWMRHSNASHAIARGMPIEIAQQNLGQVSLATMTVVVTTESKRRMKAVETFWKT